MADLAPDLDRDQLAQIVERVVLEAHRQHDKFGRFGYERPGVRLGLACIEDEVREALGALDEDRHDQDLGPRWAYTQGEVTQVAAIAVRLIYDLVYN